MTAESHIQVADIGMGWQTSSYSGGQGNCVQVGLTRPDVVPVRDSKRPGGPIIGFGRDAWAAFLDGMR